MDIKSRIADVAPSAVVVVATIRALKMQGGIPKELLKEPNVEALAAGVENLKRHVHNIEKFGVTPVVAVNKFATDTTEELDWLLAWCAREGVQAAVADVWGRGGGGDEAATSLRRRSPQCWRQQRRRTSVICIP